MKKTKKIDNPNRVLIQNFFHSPEYNKAKAEWSFKEEYISNGFKDYMKKQGISSRPMKNSETNIELLHQFIYGNSVQYNPIGCFTTPVQMTEKETRENDLAQKAVTPIFGKDNIIVRDARPWIGLRTFILDKSINLDITNYTPPKSYLLPKDNYFVNKDKFLSSCYILPNTVKPKKK